jgi:hypothetical protein
MAGLSAPAQRALKNNGITTFKKLAKVSEEDLLKLHGMGPASLPMLRAALKAEGLVFRGGEKAAKSSILKASVKSSKERAPEKTSASRKTGIKSSARGPMRMKNIDADTPAEYLAALSGWRLAMATTLRKAVLASVPKALEERIKWGHLVYFSNGPLLLIRAEGARVLFGFWRGQRLRDIEPRLKAGGKYEMATLESREGDKVPSSATVTKLVKAAVALNKAHGDPQAAAR